MKNLIFLLLCLSSILSLGQNVPSGVYVWPAGNSGMLLNGSADILSQLSVETRIVPPGSKYQTTKVSDNEEHLLLVKSGSLEVVLRDTTHVLGKGSIVLVIPGDKYSVGNAGKEAAEYHMMKYASKAAPDKSRAQAGGGSFVKDWNKIEFKPHARGGVRSYFERPTAMSKRFEMHVTTLNPGLKSHDPHTHKAEEIVLILEGNTEMQIGDKFYKATAGDVIFVGTELLHGIRNEGTSPASYFAYQWE